MKRSKKKKLQQTYNEQIKQQLQTALREDTSILFISYKNYISYQINTRVFS